LVPDSCASFRVFLSPYDARVSHMSRTNLWCDISFIFTPPGLKGLGSASSHARRSWDPETNPIQLERVRPGRRILAKQAPAPIRLKRVRAQAGEWAPGETSTAPIRGERVRALAGECSPGKTSTCIYPWLKSFSASSSNPSSASHTLLATMNHNATACETTVWIPKSSLSLGS
jgi:hypothetical protein